MTPDRVYKKEKHVPAGHQQHGPRLNTFHDELTVIHLFTRYTLLPLDGSKSTSAPWISVYGCFNSAYPTGSKDSTLKCLEGWRRQRAVGAAPSSGRGLSAKRLQVQYLGQTLHALPASAMTSLQVVQLSLTVQTHTCMLIVRSRHSHHPQAVTENRWKDDNYSILILFLYNIYSKCAADSK